MVYRFSHIGVPVDALPERAESVSPLNIRRLDGAEDEMAFEYTVFSAGGPLPEALGQEIHVGYDVDDMDAALKTAEEILLMPFSLPGGKRIAVIRRYGVLVELVQQESDHG